MLRQVEFFTSQGCKDAKDALIYKQVEVYFALDTNTTSVNWTHVPYVSPTMDK